MFVENSLKKLNWDIMRGMRLTDELCEYRVWLISPIPNTIIRQIYKKQKFLGSIPLFCHFFGPNRVHSGLMGNFLWPAQVLLFYFIYRCGFYNEMIYNQALWRICKFNSTLLHLQHKYYKKLFTYIFIYIFYYLYFKHEL